MYNSGGLLSSDSNIHRLIYFTDLDGDAVPLPLGDGEKTVIVGPRSLFGKKNQCKCKKNNCKMSKCFDWCKQNCACCKKPRTPLQNAIAIHGMMNLKHAKKCKKWRKKANWSKCKRKLAKLLLSRFISFLYKTRISKKCFKIILVYHMHNFFLDGDAVFEQIRELERQLHIANQFNRTGNHDITQELLRLLSTFGW